MSLPPDVPGESEPPDVLLALSVAAVLFDDLASHLRGEEEADRADLLLRISAVARVLRRVKNRIEGDSDGGV